MIKIGDCDVCANSRVRPGVRCKDDLDACPRCAAIAEMQWVYHVGMARPAEAAIGAPGGKFHIERKVA